MELRSRLWISSHPFGHAPPHTSLFIVGCCSVKLEFSLESVHLSVPTFTMPKCNSIPPESRSTLHIKVHPFLHESG